MNRIIAVLVLLTGFLGLYGCVHEERVTIPPSATPAEGFRADDALPPEGFAPGWKAIPGSYIYASSPDDLWKIYDGAAPGLVNMGAREAAAQGYEASGEGQDKTFRAFLLRFVDQAQAVTFLEKEMEDATDGETLPGITTGKIFDRGKAPWARFVIGRYQVSINWEGGDEDSDDVVPEAVGAIAAKLPAE